MTDKLFSRDIQRVWTANKQQQSPLHANSAVIPPGHWQRFDPFLLMFEDWFYKGTFDVHPHRGIETITYVIEGTLDHFDNQAGEFSLYAGDVQWMTAGSGVIHKEDPREGEEVHSLQLWLNLPRTEKMTAPRYQNLRRDTMPVRKEEGAKVIVFSGSSYGVQSNTLNHVPVTMVDITIEAGYKISQDIPSSYNGFIYVIEGEGVFGENETEAQKGHVLWLDEGEGNETSLIKLSAKTDLHVILCAGKPLNEPVVAQGPFVMNTKEDIQQAYSDYMAGRFVASSKN